MTLQPKCEDVETAEGVAITVTGCAQVSIYSQSFLRHIYFRYFNFKYIILVIWLIINAQICQDGDKPFIPVALRLQVLGLLLSPI